MSGSNRPGDRCRYDRTGNIAASGLWLGPAAGGERYRYLLVVCPACQAEQVLTPHDLGRLRHEWDVRVKRSDDGSVTIRSECHDRPVMVLASCLSCRWSLAIHPVGRKHEPWTFGTGIVHPMPPFEAAADDDGGCDA